jgi:hypothetical protein
MARNLARDLLFSAVALGPFCAHASSSEPYVTVCRGEVTKTDQPANARYANGIWIGECFVKLSTEMATVILSTCNLNRPCVIRATVREVSLSSWSGELEKDVLEVHTVTLGGSDMTCRGKLSTDRTSGDFARIGKCYLVIPNRSAAASKIHSKCRENDLCIVRARVVDNEITAVYSARRGR